MTAKKKQPAKPAAPTTKTPASVGTGSTVTSEVAPEGAQHYPPTTAQVIPPGEQTADTPPEEQPAKKQPSPHDRLDALVAELESRLGFTLSAAVHGE